MAAVKRARLAKQPSWSAERLAEEMTKAGVPWNADIVVNLEHGRRKSLRVHELLALLFVLDVRQPLEVIVPGGEVTGDAVFPVVPGLLVKVGDVRAWLRGDTAPLRHTLAEGTVGAGTTTRSVMESVAQLLEQQGRPEEAASTRRVAELLALPEDTDGQD